MMSESIVGLEDQTFRLITEKYLAQKEILICSVTGELRIIFEYAVWDLMTEYLDTSDLY